MDATSLLAYCESQSGWLREAIETLVRAESPSTDKAAVDRCGRELARLLTDAGGAVTTIVQPLRGDHLRAEFRGASGRVLILGHFDTVWDVGTLASMPLREENGKLFGPGVFDMKAGLGVALLAIRAVRSLGPSNVPTIVALFTTDEEIGSATSRALIEEEARHSGAVLVLEPSLPGGAAKTSRKGCGEFELIVHGVEAHAGIDPRQGASAIHELARQVLAIEALEDRERGVTVNVGTVDGGTRINVVAAEARAGIDVRVPTMADAARVETAMRALQSRTAGTRLEIRGGVGRPPLERGAHVVALYERARVAAAFVGRELKEGSTGGGSDGNFTAALGVPTLDGLGPSGDGAHARHEHVILDDLPWRAAFVAALLVRALEGNG